jgi:predicted deacylase
MSAHPETHFPKDYRSARHDFVAAAEAAGLGATSRANLDAAAPDGKTLFLDSTTIGPRDAAKALLLISGTHGVEGYFGSGVETGLIREGLATRAPKDVKIVLVHALNPYGFAWDRRVNEDNADVNRNFVDHANPPDNPAYRALAEWISPRDIGRDAIRAANARLRAYAEAHGDFALQEAITRGQYEFADGIYYGGPRESWSAKMIKDVLVEDLKHAKTLIVIDFHTGLGDEGAGEMITEALPDSAAYKRQKKIWGDRVKSSEAGESVSAPLVGTIDKAFAAWLPAVELTFVALEVGTKPTRDVFSALRKDNWLHCFAGKDHPDAAAIRKEIRDAFYVDTPDWKRAVWNHANTVVYQALEALA